MAERKQVDEIYSMTRLRHQKTPVAALNKINMGVGAVLRCLDEAQGKRLTAGELSRQLGVSSARIAVILNKMSSEKLVIKSRENSDARVVVVELTALGEQMAQDIMTKMKELIGRGIDKIGFDRMAEFVRTINDLCDGSDEEACEYMCEGSCSAAGGENCAEQCGGTDGEAADEAEGGER